MIDVERAVRLGRRYLKAAASSKRMERAYLLGFAEDDVASELFVILFELETACAFLLVFGRPIDLGALGALELDGFAILAGHSLSSPEKSLAQDSRGRSPFSSSLSLSLKTLEGLEFSLSTHFEEDRLFSAPARNKVHFVSLGCPRNFVDTEVMLGILLKAGYEVTDDLKKADYLVVNTCAFLEASRSESKETIRELMESKKKSAKLIVAGCMVTRHREEIERTFPGVHYLLGSGDVEGILKAVQSDTPGEVIGSGRSYLEAGEVPRKVATPSHFAYLKIAEGCRKACAYCIIPKIKGPLQSKPKERIMQEFKALLAQGVEEIILIAQDLGDYGKDFAGHQRKGDLVALLKELLTIEGDYWLRLLYLYPDEVTDELIELMKQDKRLCPYFDMPIQHINDRILKSMRRTVSSRQVKELLTKLRREIPDIHVRTSLIAGFPGEGEAEFQELVEFLQEYPIDHVGIFPFSREPESAAYHLDNQVDEEVKQRRVELLSSVQLEVVEALHSKLIGKRLEVVVEGYHPESQLLMVGRHRGQCPEIDGCVILNEADAVKAFGKRYLVEITGIAGHDLIGRAIKPIKGAQMSKSKFKFATV